jgi:hypothetical protein
MHSYREDKYNIYTKTYMCRNTLFFITCYIVLLLMQTIFYNVVLKLSCFSGITTSLTRTLGILNRITILSNDDTNYNFNASYIRYC